MFLQTKQKDLYRFYDSVFLFHVYAEEFVQIMLFGPIYRGKNISFSICWADGLTSVNFYSILENIRLFFLYSKKEERYMTTSKKEASRASKILSNPKATKVQKSVAASDLAQAKKPKKGK